MISAATALAYLGAPVTDTAIIQGIIDRATATLERALGFYLGVPADREKIITAKGTSFLLVDEVLTPTVENPITVEYLDGDWEWQEFESGVWRRVDRKFIHKYEWPCGEDGIRVRYRSGWNVDTGPAELRDLVLRLTALRYRASGDTGGLESETLSDFSWTAKDDKKFEEDWTRNVAAWSRLPRI